MSDSIHLYSRLAKCFKSGGFNGRANTPADQSAFDPEEVWTLEFGAKTSMADGRLQANYAVFWSQYDDFQARVSLGEGLEATFPVLNAAELDIAGAEVELVWVPIDPLQLTAQVGYLDSEYGAGGFSGADGIPDEPAFSPKWTMRYAGMYTFDLSGGGTLNFGADAHYRDEMQLSVENTPALMEDSYWVFNGWVNWTSADQHWSLTGGMKNATDEVYKVEGQDFRSVANVQTSYFGDPKTWTVTLEYRY
jgi:iron complex outermembrane receptor protein